eukprot:GHVH01012686.1.p1 GENE.GHVH01012686.1~~GHVH01012686.1.p1  ORF type:complete len:426 (+),score=55.82 GHVH01012686.1:183-1460(+)
MSSMKLVKEWDVPKRYELREHLGSGSYGYVRAAFDSETKTSVAIKRITHLFEDLTDCKRVLREVCILNRLKHDLIVNLVDIIIPKDFNNFQEVSLVFEYVPSDFKKLLRQNVWLTELHVKTLMYNSMMAIKYGHSAGVYHRDLKPANCLVNEDCIVKICDFGLARTVKHPNRKEGLGRMNTLPGVYGSAQDCVNNSAGVPVTAKEQQKMTTHVVTRWYRAPELILLNENYSGAVDVWSLACIFAELMQMMSGNAPSYSDRQPLFPGGSCFPLSPDRRRQTDYKFHAQGGKDQLGVIFSVMGSPSSADVACLERQDARKYLEYFDPKEPQNMQKLFPKSSPEAIDLLKRMLTFNPTKRITVEDALKHKFFANIRHPELERSASQPCVLPFDDDEDLTERELRYHFLKEISKFHPELNIDKVYPLIK